ncbi:hypothetical protein CAC42_3233 [Sphaceloma murrayae]|uniref:Uncharacterized protein n=1 Tax=Sphaceloma murrayae TaxID=2082308 RepID=A0A2K1QFT9_9PEZI|nr:hypothetical protein CAC42_3233 [Sphaceloma murrayae]
MDHKIPQLLLLPVEIRLQIYSYLIVPALDNDGTHNESLFVPIANDHYPTSSRPSLRIRSLEPGSVCALAPELPNKYLVRDFRGQSLYTTFHLAPNPSLHPAILATSRALYADTAPVLYGSVLDFGTNIEAIGPFFGSLRPETRQLVQTVRITKRPQCYDKEYDLLEWQGAMRCLSQLTLCKLELIVMAGRPARVAGVRGSLLGDLGEIRGYEDEEWPGLLEAEGFEWVRSLVGIRGLRELKLVKLEGHSPPPVSKGLERWTDGGALREHLRDKATVDSLRIAGSATFLIAGS